MDSRPGLPALAHVFPRIPGGVLAALLDATGPSAKMSPRHAMPAAATLQRDDLARLYAVDILTDPAAPLPEAPSKDFRSIAAVLRDPTINLTLRLWSHSSDCAETNFQFPRGIAEGHGVILQSGEDGWQISAFADSEHVIAAAAPFLRWAAAAGDAAPPPFEALLDFASAMALCAGVDFCLGQTSDAPRSFTVPELHAYLHARWGVSGFEELLTHGMAAIMAGHPPELQPFGLAVRTLSRCGIFTSEDDEHFSLAPGFLPAARCLCRPAAGLVWQRVSRLPDGVFERSCQSFLAVNGAVLRLAPGRPGELYFELGDATMARDFVADELAALPATKAPPPPTRTGPEPKPPPGGVIPPAIPSPTADAPSRDKRSAKRKTAIVVVAGILGIVVLTAIWAVASRSESGSSEEITYSRPPEHSAISHNEPAPPRPREIPATTRLEAPDPDPIPPPPPPRPSPSLPPERFDLALVGSIKFMVYFGSRTVELDCQEIANYRTTPTGGLKITLWANRDMGYATGTTCYVVAEHNMPPLGSGMSHKNLKVAIPMAGSLVPGDYYIAATLYEFRNGGFARQNTIFFPNPIRAP